MGNHWKHLKVRDIVRRDVLAIIDAIVERPAPVMADRVWALASRIFNDAIEQDMLDTGNPATRLKKQPERSRERVLDDNEIRALWTALDTVMGPPRTDDADAKPPAITAMIALDLQVLLLTAQRPGEVFKMRWQDVDLDGGWWTIPAEYSKNGEPHRVPLTDRVVALLKEAKTAGLTDNPWVFAGNAGANVTARAKKAMAEVVAWFHRFCGYLLTGDAGEQCFVIGWGGGSKGKDTCVTTLASVMGSYAFNLPFSAMELHARASIPNDLASLVNRRFATASESGEATRLNEARMKMLTGGGTCTARFLHSEFFSGGPDLTFWRHAANLSRSAVQACYRRLAAVPDDAG
jgi:hypothetical protein